MSSASVTSSSSDFYSDALVWDAHAGVFPSPKVDLSLLNDWRDSGVNYLSINVGFDVMDWQQTLSTLAAYRRWIGMHEDRFILAGTVADIARAKQQGKLAVSFDIEGMKALAGDLNMLGVYHALGVRQMLFAYNLNNDAAGGCHDTDIGLTDFGRSIVREMNRLGMLIDVSHISDEAFYNVVELSKVPVFASHSDVRAVCDNPRNMTDDMLYKLKENRGVLQLCLLSDYVKKMPQVPVRDSAFKALRIKYNYFRDLTDEQYNKGVVEWYETNAKYPPNLASVKDLVDHLDHVVKTIGIDYVGIGSDFDGGGGLKDCYDASEFGNITLELVRRGYTEDDICKIWGGNFMRVFKEVELYANNLN